MRGIVMDIEIQLRQLESRYRAASSAAVGAKAHYLALAGEPSATPAAVQRAKATWQKLDTRKCAIAARMGELEEKDQAASA
jgi:hypothetical protein